MALATGLEHAVPIPQSNLKAQADAPATVDPVNRYLHYDKAYIEANESMEVHAVTKACIAEADRKIVVGQNGVITIPAVAFSKPASNTARHRELLPHHRAGRGTVSGDASGRMD